MAAACAGLRRIREQADCVELRLDLFQEPFDLPMLMREAQGLPVVATLRPPEQGGGCTLPASERLNVLVRAAELGAQYVDLEWDAATPAALSAVRQAGARAIVSRHDFASMPRLSDDWSTALADAGADVVKVVGTARRLSDCLEVFRTFARADRPTIAIAMGEAGLITRVLVLRSKRCLLTYAALDEGIGTAPGQLTLSEMRETYRSSRLGERTRVFGLLGPHLERDRLAEYNTWFAADGFDAVAVPFVASDSGQEIVSAFRELPVAGWHVHGDRLQADVLGALDELGPTARAKKVNAVIRRVDGTLVGFWVESPREQFELWRDLSSGVA